MMIFSNLIKSDSKMWIEIGEFSIFGKKTQKRIHRIKITEFGSRFEEKSLNEQERNFQN